MTALVEVKGLDKAFGGVHAVEGVSFSVEAGQVYSVIGPMVPARQRCLT